MGASPLMIVGAGGVLLRAQVVRDRTAISFVDDTRNAGRNVFRFAGQPDQQFVFERGPTLTNWTDSTLLEFDDGTGTLLYLETVAPQLPQEFYRARLFP